MNNLSHRIENETLKNKVVSPEDAAQLIEDGMILGVSGFALFGEPKRFMHELAKRGKDEKLKIDLYTGASMASAADDELVKQNMINRRLPYQAHPVSRAEINKRNIAYIDQHLSHTGETLRQGVIGPIDYAVIEATAIKEDGSIILSGSVGNSPIFAQYAKHVIIEVNTQLPLEYEGLHDIYIPEEQGDRDVLPLTKIDQRIGTPGLKIDLDKVKAVIVSEEDDYPSPLFEPTEDTQKIADYLLDFLDKEISEGRLTEELAPLQSGVGSVANAVLSGMAKSKYKDIVVSSEVFQDGMFDLIEAGVVKFVSATAFSLSKHRTKTLKEDIKKHHDKILFRPQEISNNPELIRRLGVIAFNTAIEVDLYGNVNSTHLNGTHMMNGIGGSADFTRNAKISMFVTESTAKNGKISTIVPFVSHVDHTNHEVDVIITEQGYADLRGLSPREIALEIINNCMHPDFKEQALDYYNEALEKGGHTPHVLKKAHSWHINLEENGTMLLK